MTAAVVVLDIHDDSLTAGISVLVMTVALHVHRQYGHVPPWRKSLGDVSLSTRGTCRIFWFAGKRTGNVSPPFPQRPDRERTAILLLFVSNPSRRHRHLRTVLPVLHQRETSRNGSAGHSERPFHRWFKRKRGQNVKIWLLTLYIVMHCHYDRMYWT